jgi:hypothetical protein
MLHVKALHLADNRPYIFEDRWIDTTSCPEILSVDLTRESANEWLVRHKPYSRIEVRFSAMNAEGESAKHLATPVGAPCSSSSGRPGSARLRSRPCRPWPRRAISFQPGTERLEALVARVAGLARARSVSVLRTYRL